MVRKVSVHDAQRLCDIYNYYIQNTASTFEEKPLTVSEMEARITEICNMGFPFCVYEIETFVVGYYYLNTWNKRVAFRPTAELSVYVDNKYGKRGIGSALMTHLCALSNLNLHTIVSAITIPNEPSVKLHEKFGFKKVSHFFEVGYKLQQWHDLEHWQLLL